LTKETAEVIEMDSGEIWRVVSAIPGRAAKASKTGPHRTPRDMLKRNIRRQQTETAKQVSKGKRPLTLPRISIQERS
jgi:hypothetical protein